VRSCFVMPLPLRLEIFAAASNRGDRRPSPGRSWAQGEGLTGLLADDLGKIRTIVIGSWGIARAPLPCGRNDVGKHRDDYAAFLSDQPLSLLIELAALAWIERRCCLVEQGIILVEIEVGLVPLRILAICDRECSGSRPHAPVRDREGLLQPDRVPIFTGCIVDDVDLDTRLG